LSSALVPVVSIVASATVAIVVPFFTARLNRMERREARTAVRLDDIAAVIDVASQALAHAEDAIDQAAAAVEAETRTSATPAEIQRAEQTVTQVQAALKEVREVRHRLATRLGWNAQLCTTYETVLNQLRDELMFVEGVRIGGPAGDNPEAWTEVALVLAGYTEQYAARRDAFYEVTAASMELGFADTGPPKLGWSRLRPGVGAEREPRPTTA